jgi:hypothetical protein
MVDTGTNEERSKVMDKLIVNLTREDGTVVQREFESTEVFTAWWDLDDEATQFVNHDAKGAI